MGVPRRITTAVGVLVSATTILAYADTLTVCSSGCDYASIQEAVFAAASGDTVQLGAGTFFENVCVRAPGSGALLLTIRGLGPHATVVNGSGEDQPVFAVNASNDDTECSAGRRNTVLSLADMTIENSAGCGVLARGSGTCHDQCRPPVFSDVNIDNSVIRYNGCGVRNSAQSEIHIRGTTITGNFGSGFDQGGFESSLTDTTISGNHWGVHIASNRARLSNSTVSGNAVGVRLSGGGPVVLSQSTIANNLGPGLMLPNSPGSRSFFDVTGSIVANNLGGNCWTTSQGHNLSSEPCLDAVPTDITATDPLLLPLTDNGGLTPTHALHPDSPAIDAGGGECGPTDQRGIPRPMDGDGDGVAKCDIGAFEHVPPAASVSQLIEHVESLNLPHGIENGLLAKLNAALLVLTDVPTGNDNAAVNILGAFINAAEAQHGKKIAAANADALIHAAEEIIGLL